MRKRILVVDDEATVRQALKRQLEGLGYEAICASGGDEAIAHLKSEVFDLCITDLIMPGNDGFAVLEAARKHSPPVAVIVITGQGTVRDAVEALRAGANDFVSKPFHPSAVENAVRRYLETGRRALGWQPTHGASLVGEHPAIRLVLERIDQVAESDANVLIHGEEGTGKEVVARLIHASSARNSGPFVPVNLSAIPQALCNAELFGQTSNGQNGDRTRPGKILAASHGTLFIHEVAELPVAAQDGLIDVLKTRQVVPIGATQGAPADLRIITSTSRAMDELVRDGSFREDLFYRLNVIPIDLPPLRDRADDIALVAEHLREEMNARHGRSVPAFRADLLDRLRSYDWPGNVRQMANIIERMVMTVSNREVTVEDLPANLRTSVLDLAHTPLDLPATGVDLRMLLSQLESRLIGQALQRTGGNKNRAAELLGLNRTTLVEKLRRRSVA
ncbi:MAG: sigma-54 dependent transcriptional regulator [Deltaproteobacteria bacterium]|nr:sigma-54 dependent transcriptional regulator [Deltaproteobacteria bacterium]